MTSLKAQLEIGADVSGVEAGISRAKRSINSLGVAVQDSNSRAGKSIDRYVKSLEQQAATFGKSSREVELYKLGLKGASDAQIKAADTALRLREGYERGQIAGERLRAGFLALGAAAATGLIAATVAFDSLIKKAGDFQDMAEKYGDTAENFASLAVAAGTAGVSMDTVGAAAGRLTKSLTGVDDESKDAGAAIAALGLNLEKFKALAPADQFETVAKALNGFEDGASKTAVAMALFGKSGAELLPFMKELGVEGGRQVILTGQQIKLADEYADRQAKLRTEIGLHAQAIAVELLPQVNSYLQSISDLVKDQEFAAAATGVLKGALSGAAVVFQTIAVLVSDVAFVFKGVGREIGGILAQLDALARWDFNGFRAISNAMKEDAERARAELDRFQAGIMGLGQAQAAPVRTTGDFARSDRAAQRPTLRFTGGTGGGKGKKDNTAEQEAKEQLRADLQAIKDGSIARLAAFDAAESIMEARRAASLVDDRAYYESKRAFIRLDAEEKDRALRAEIARIEQDKTTGKDAIAQQREIAKLQAERSRIAADATAKIEVVTIREADSIDKLTRAYQEARDSAADYLSTISKRSQREIAGLGQGNRARGIQAELNSVEDRFLEERSKLSRDLRRGDINEDQYKQYLDIAKSTYTQEVEIYSQANAQKLAAQQDWSIGASEALNNYLDNVRDVAGETEQLFSNAFGSIEDALVNFVQTGKLDFKGLANSIAADVARMAIRQSITGPLAESLLGSVGGKGIAAVAGANSKPSIDTSGVTTSLSSLRTAGIDPAATSLARLAAAADMASGSIGQGSPAFSPLGITGQGADSTTLPTGDFARMDRGQSSGEQAVMGLFKDASKSGNELVQSNAEASKVVMDLANAAAKGGGALSLLPSIVSLIQTSAAIRSAGGSGGGFLGSLGSLFGGGSSAATFTTGQQGFLNELGGLETLGSLGFSSGGYTGDIAPSKAAGIVHGGEYVFSAPAVRSIGVAALEGMHTRAKVGLPGYSDGGLVEARPQYVTQSTRRDQAGGGGRAGDTIHVNVTVPGGSSRDHSANIGREAGRQAKSVLAMRQRND